MPVATPAQEAQINGANTRRSRMLDCFANRELVYVGGLSGTIESITHEDGSGFSFNLTVRVYMHTHEVYFDARNGRSTYVRCID